MKLCLDCKTKTVEKNRRICSCCKSRRLKKSNPYLYFFNLLRCGAKRRGISFSLTKDQFKAFAVQTDYMTKKGKKSSGYSIDRINPNEGYHIDNIQVLTLRANCKKSVIYDHFSKSKFRVEERNGFNSLTNYSDVPF